MHDQSVDRLTNGKGKVEDLSYAYIRSLKIQRTQNYKDKNYSVPNFKEVLKTCQGRINIYLDFKENNNVKKAYQLIKKYDMEDQLVVYLNAKEQYGKWRKTAPKIPLMTSIPKGLNETQLDDLLNEYKIDIVDNAYDPERIEWLHQKDITIWTDVESENEGPDVWQKMIDRGVDGLQTDHPEELIQYLKKKRLR